MSKDLAVDRCVEVAELRRQIGAIDADITLVNERINESQGMCSAFLIMLYRKIWEGHNINVIYLDCRWCCCRGSPEGGTFPGQGTSSG